MEEEDYWSFFASIFFLSSVRCLTAIDQSLLTSVAIVPKRKEEEITSGKAQDFSSFTEVL